MKCQILFSKKNKKDVISLSSVEYAHNVISVKHSYTPPPPLKKKKPVDIRQEMPAQNMIKQVPPVVHNCS